MKIGLVIYDSLDFLTGGYLYNRYLVDFLRSKSFQLEIIVLPGRIYPRALFHNYSTGIYRQLNNGYDLLIQDALTHPSLFLLNQRLRKESATIILSLVHSLRAVMCRRSPFRSVYYNCERRYFESVDGLICTSGFTASQVERCIGRSLPGVVARPGTGRFMDLPGPEEISERAGRDRPLRILFLGNILPGKRLHDLCAALSWLGDKEFHLSVVGSTAMDPGYTSEIRKQISHSGLDSRIELHGQLEGEELQLQLRRAHLLAVPSDSEAFGIAYLEGFAFGLPAIAGSLGGASEIITHGKNGFLVDPGDVVSLSRYLQTLDQDRDRLVGMSLSARRSYENHPSWQESMEKVHGFLAEIGSK